MAPLTWVELHLKGVCYESVYNPLFVCFSLSADLSIVDGEEDCVYFCGNSLGLCPRDTKKYMDAELDKWAKL